MQEAIQGCSWCYDGCILGVQKVIWHGDRLNYGWSVWIWGGSPLTFIRNCHRFNPNGPQMWKPRPPQTSLPGCNLSSDLLLLNMTRFCRGENWRKQHTHGELLGGGCQEKQTMLLFLVAVGARGDADHCYKTPWCLFPKSKSRRPELLDGLVQGQMSQPWGWERGKAEGNEKNWEERVSV